MSKSGKEVIVSELCRKSSGSACHRKRGFSQWLEGAPDQASPGQRENHWRIKTPAK